MRVASSGDWLGSLATSVTIGVGGSTTVAGTTGTVANVVVLVLVNNVVKGTFSCIAGSIEQAVAKITTVVTTKNCLNNIP
ncbi:MAG: hypothetical protein AAEB43_04555 [Acidimicrobiales bacterium]|jgi:hypothetical protein